MATYYYDCPEHGTIEVVRKMGEAKSETICPVPECGNTAKKLFTLPTGIIYYSDGFHTTDYGKGMDGLSGDKRDLLNKAWERHYGEKAPPPAKDVPKVIKEPY